MISHTMNLWERIVEKRLRSDLKFSNQQYGFMPGKSTTYALFALRVLLKKYREGQKELHCVFVDLDNAYDKVPREEVRYCMIQSGLAEKYVMYDDRTTAVRCAVHSKNKWGSEGPLKVLQFVPNTGPYSVLRGTPVEGASKDPHAMVL